METYGYCPYTTDSHYGEYIKCAWEHAIIRAIREKQSIYVNGVKKPICADCIRIHKYYKDPANKYK
ncbi:MAG: hypothetical protein KGD73_13235 [Candidatus Lokiarchaeota archaeon]|nr:hypothetical protein [Candidatus Lokiarchaeota archaeon]